MVRNICKSLFAVALLLCTVVATAQVTINLADYGVRPGDNGTILLQKALTKALQKADGSHSVVITMPKGTYQFYPDDAAIKEYYISNHDQVQPKHVAFPIENVKNVTLDANGSDFIFHGRMMPFSLIGTENCSLKNFSIDFVEPHICQITVKENDAQNGFITFEVAPWTKYVIRGRQFYMHGSGWEIKPLVGVPFEKGTKHLLYGTGDINIGCSDVEEIAPRVIKARWKDARLVPGTMIALRGYGRPTPAILVSDAKNTVLKNIKVHYAEGMGLLAQLSENITLDGFGVCLRGDDDPRCFTTQADATHFSACKGVIESVNGLYENMMDDAINVHGTYLKIVKRIDDYTIVGQYMHHQSYGFDWGMVGDTVKFIASRTMEYLPELNTIANIRPVDKPTFTGAKLIEIKLTNPLPSGEIGVSGSYGIENLTWTPQVRFAGNIVRNNRARGALVSTPKKSIIEDNFFDHTSGAAILLCGDCNGWFETGACHDVTIRNNRFVNALTSMFQFTNAVISIYPEIPNLKDQKLYLHSGVVIENNEFDTFDSPILYAKSVDGIVFKNNVIKQNTNFKPFHWNKYRIMLEHVTNADVEGNTYEGGFNKETDFISK